MFFIESKITCDIPQILKWRKRWFKKKYSKTGEYN